MSRQASAAAPAPRGHQLHLRDVFADDLQSIDDGRANDDRRAVLVVMEDRYLHAFAQLFLDIETFRRLDVFEIDAAERRFEGGDDVHQLVRIAFVHLDVEDIDAGEFLEQDGLAFHYRLGGERADVAKPKHRSAVSDNRYQVAA